MDLMRGLTRADGCAVDGTAATQNPLAQVVNQMMGSAPGLQQKPGQQSMGGVRHQGPRGTPQQQMNSMDQGMAMGMGLGATASLAAPSLTVAQQDAFAREFEAERQARAQQQQMGGMRNPGFMGPRGAPGAMFNGNLSDQWIQQFEGMKLSNAGGYMHPQQQSRGQNWATEMARGPGPISDMERAWRQMQPDGHAWAQEAARQKEHAMATFRAQQQQQHHHHQQQQAMATSATMANAPKTAADAEATRRATAEMANIMSQNPNFQDSEFLNFMKQVSSGDVIFENNEVVQNPNKPSSQQTVGGDLNSAWEQAGVSAEDENAVRMENIFRKAWEDSMNGKEVNYDEIWSNAMKEGAGDLSNLWNSSSEEMWNSMAHSQHDSNYVAPYELAEKNPYSTHDNAFEEGMALFKDGRLAQAVLAFESVVEKDPSHADAWRMLGVAHQENDEDPKAIACLQRAVDQDAYHLDALLGLGVSYVNELNEHGALTNLKAWVMNNPSFHGLKVEADEYSDGSLKDDVMQLMLKAAKFAPNDPGVHEVLGVLYNVSKDYDSAVKSFKIAINAKPNDYALWNKLGATLANGQKSEEALPAYHRALELKPRYARGWLNLGISHSNLSNFSESARCYLKALDLNPSAHHIWSYLRSCFIAMDRRDLIALSDQRNVELFRQEFNF